MLEDQMTLPARAWQTAERTFHLVISQGLNRQIRRMCEALGYEVVDLLRVRVMHITLGSQKEGELRELSPKEKQELFKRLGMEDGRP
jgi:23S rRNA pseudouridine2604 synthase